MLEAKDFQRVQEIDTSESYIIYLFVVFHLGRRKGNLCLMHPVAYPLQDLPDTNSINKLLLLNVAVNYTTVFTLKGTDSHS